MRHTAFGLVSMLLLAGCASSGGATPEYVKELKALRPSGYGGSNYGLAACSVGTCQQAQREYHVKYFEIRERHRAPVPPIYGPLFPYAEAVAARVDNGEISTAQAEAAIQELRARLGAEAARVDASRAQADAAYWSGFWQGFQPATPMKPIYCTTTSMGRMATTTCQ